MFSSTNPAPGVTFTSTSDYSGFYTSTDPDRRFVFDYDAEDGFAPSIVLASVAPHRHPLTLDEAKAEAQGHYAEVIRDAQARMAHIETLTSQQFS